MCRHDPIEIIAHVNRLSQSKRTDDYNSFSYKRVHKIINGVLGTNVTDCDQRLFTILDAHTGTLESILILQTFELKVIRYFPLENVESQGYRAVLNLLN